jgi:REP element-mobilizing transposase RayT
MNYPHREYSQAMADTYTKILIHCVFSTKDRTPRITEPEQLWTYLRGIARNRGVDILAIGGTQNHVHILLALPTGLTISNLVRDLKAKSVTTPERKAARVCVAGWLRGDQRQPFTN